MIDKWCPTRFLRELGVHVGAKVVPSSTFNDFGFFFGSYFGTKNVQNPTVDQFLKVLFSNLTLFFVKYALRESIQIFKNDHISGGLLEDSVF